jgi:hypothetical protein
MLMEGSKGSEGENGINEGGREQGESRMGVK